MVVGLTGGIGSGQTTVAQIFEKLGVSVYNSDQRAKDLYSENPELKKLLQAHFGENIYTGNQINRPKLAEIVFNNKKELQVLNGFVHPLLQVDFERWYKKQDAPYVLREAAILIESGAYKYCDKIIVITADEAERISRVTKRDQATEEQVKSRIANQLSDSERLVFADFEIKNNGKESLIEQVLEIHSQLK